MRIHRSYCDVLMRLSFLLSSYLFELLGRHMAIPTVSLFRHALHSAPNPAHCPVLTGALVLWLAAGSGRCETQTGHRRAGGWEVRLSCLFPPVFSPLGSLLAAMTLSMRLTSLGFNNRSLPRPLRPGAWRH